jgi:VanZ family protein
LYVPAGLCGYLAFRRSRGALFALIVPVLIALGMSTSVELLQVYETVRRPNILDVLCNVAGCAVGVVSGAVFSAVSTKRRTADAGVYLVLACWLASLGFPFVPVIAGSVLFAKARMFLASDPFSLSAFASAFASWYVAGFLLARAGVRRPVAWLMLSLGMVPAQIFVVSRQPVWGHLLGAVGGVLAFSLTRVRYRALAAIVILSALIVRGLAPFDWKGNPAAFSWMPFASTIDASWQGAMLTLLEKMYYTSAAIWTLSFAGVRFRLAVVIVSALILGIEVLQTMLPGRTPEVTDPVLAVLMGIAIDAFRRTSSPERPGR